MRRFTGERLQFAWERSYPSLAPHDAVDSVSLKGTLGSELRGAPGFSGAREPERVTLLAAPVSCCRSMVVILWVLAIETLNRWFNAPRRRLTGERSTTVG
jgi:hypothetical protein